MSYDLTFAKPKRKIAKKRVTELYASLRRGESDESFEPLPVEDIVERQLARRTRTSSQP